MKIKLRNPFHRKYDSKKDNSNDNENVIEQDITSGTVIQATREDIERQNNSVDFTEIHAKRISFSSIFHGKTKNRVATDQKKESNNEESIREHNAFERFAYNTLSSHLPGFDEFRESYGQSGIPVIFEQYISTGILLSLLVAIPVFAVSLLIEIKVFPSAPIALPVVGSIVLAGVATGVAFVLWLSYPMIKRRGFKSRLENQLAYSFGILGVLAAAGMNLDRLFERIANSESNPVLADLAKRFLRNIRVFGLDTETALAEVAQHSPSEAFSKMLGSIGVAHKTTGSIHDLVMFESARLLQEKRDKLHKTTGSLAVMAELYITLVVVGPIIFIVMLAIFALLPVGKLPSPISLINLVVFIGIPVLSVMFVLLLDSVISKA